LRAPARCSRTAGSSVLWRVKAKGKKAEITVEKLGRLARAEVEPEVQRIADLRGAAQATLVLH